MIQLSERVPYLLPLEDTLWFSTEHFDKHSRRFLIINRITLLVALYSITIAISLFVMPVI